MPGHGPPKPPEPASLPRYSKGVPLLGWTRFDHLADRQQPCLHLLAIRGGETSPEKDFGQYRNRLLA